MPNSEKFRVERRAYQITASPGHTGTGYPAPGDGTRIVYWTGHPPVTKQIERRVCGEGGFGYTLGISDATKGAHLKCLPGSGRAPAKAEPFLPTVTTGKEKRGYRKSGHRVARQPQQAPSRTMKRAA
jgi:hypothetical protein